MEESRGCVLLELGRGLFAQMQLRRRHSEVKYKDESFEKYSFFSNCVASCCCKYSVVIHHSEFGLTYLFIKNLYFQVRINNIIRIYRHIKTI